MPEPFRTSRMVEFHDTDMAGIMHFASFFVYMESAEHELIRSLGFSVFDAAEGETLSFPRVHASCDYKSPARCEQVLDVAVSVARLGSRSVTYAFQFSHDGREVASGKMTSVCCRVMPGESIQSIALPQGMTDKLQAFVV